MLDAGHVDSTFTEVDIVQAGYGSAIVAVQFTWLFTVMVVYSHVYGHSSGGLQTVTGMVTALAGNRLVLWLRRWPWLRFWLMISLCLWLWLWLRLGLMAYGLTWAWDWAWA